MKKDRNTFFSNYSAQNQAYIPNMDNFQIPNQSFGPYQAQSTQASMYAGPNLGISNDFDNRLSKIERQLVRLENRVTKLENGNNTEVNDNNFSNMYMI